MDIIVLLCCKWPMLLALKAMPLYLQKHVIHSHPDNSPRFNCAAHMTRWCHFSVGLTKRSRMDGCTRIQGRT